MKRRLLLLALTTLLLLQILHAFYFHRSFYQARQAGWLQEVPQVLYSAVPGQQLVNAFDGRKISFAELNRDENKFMAAIQERSTNQISLSQEEASQLYSLLQHFVAKLSPRAYFNLISCLGSIKTNSYQWKCDKEVTLLLEYLPLKLSDQTKSEDIAKTLLGLCRLGVSWSKIQVHRQMATAISEALLSSNEKLVSDIIWTLGTLGPNWKTLPVALQQNLMKAFEKNIVRMSPFTMSSSVWAMAKVGYPWTILSKETQKIVLDKVERFSRDFTPQQSSKVLWALGTMGISYQLLPLSVIKDLISRVGDIKKSKMGNAVSSSQMFIGLARIGIPWMALSSSSSSKEIMEQATRICQSSNTKGMLNCIWALGQMGVDRSAIYPELESLLFASAAKVMPDGNGWACINVLWGLGKMKYRWDELPRSLRDSFLSTLIRVQNDLTPADVANLLWALSVVDFPLDTSASYITDLVFNAISETMSEMKAAEIARSVWGLSGCGMAWDQLPSTLQWDINKAIRTSGNQFSGQDLANCAYGLALMMFDSDNTADVTYRGVHESLLYIITKSKETYNGLDTITNKVCVDELEQLRLYAHFLSMSSVVSDPKKIPSTLLQISPSIKAPPTQPSNLQKRVVSALNEAFSTIPDGWKYSVSTELSSFDGVFPVDAMIQKNGKILAMIEVDGPQHMRWDGRMLRKDLLKEFMYLRKHPGSVFHRIRWDEENKVGADVLARELASFIEESSKKFDNVFLNVYYNVEKSVKEFFSWGLRNSKDYR